MILRLTCINSACSFAGTLYDFNRDLLRRGFLPASRADASARKPGKEYNYLVAGEKIKWRDDNGDEHTGTLVGPAEHMGYYEVQDDDGTYHFSIPAANLNFIED